MNKQFYHEYYEIEENHWWFIGRRTIIFKMLDGYLTQQPDRQQRSVLDVGCGTGLNLQYLSHFGQAQGIDIAEEAIQYCNERGIQNVQQIESQLPLPFKDNSFDLITLLDVLEHIDDDQSTLNELYRILKPNGTFLITVPAYRFLWGTQDEVNYHKRRYTASEIEAVLAKAGFTLHRLSYFNTLLFPVIAGIRLMRNVLPKPSELKSDNSMTKPGLINTLLAKFFASEMMLLKYCNLPFGVSIIGIASKGIEAVPAYSSPLRPSKPTYTAPLLPTFSKMRAEHGTPDPVYQEVVE